MMCPYAIAKDAYIIGISKIQGSKLAPNIEGIVLFKNLYQGTEVFVEIWGLPLYRTSENGKSPVGPFGFHVHDINNCTVGAEDNPFQMAGMHYNPYNQPHGNHAGDFPVLFSNNGYARMSFFTDKFRVPDIIGKSVIIHENPDDYRTQPSGNSGRRIAWGIIEAANSLNINDWYR